MRKRARVSLTSGPLATLKRGTIAGLAGLLILLSLSGATVKAAQPGPLRGPVGFNSSFRHGTVPVDGGYLHYVKGGSGPALVLLHGWPQTWYEWHLVMPALARTHTVIAFDLPGLGDSSIPRAGYDKRTAAGRLHQAVNRLGYDQVTVMAHDMSVLIGYVWARDYPDEVTRLAVLESTLLGFGLEDAYPLSFHFGLNMAPKPITERLVDNEDVDTYLNFVFEFAEVPGAIDSQYYIDAYMDPARRSAAYDYYRAWPSDAVDIRANAEARRLVHPVLAMGAEHFFGLAVAASFEHVAGDVRGVVAPGAGHWIQEETPQFLIDCASLFFGPPGVPAPSPALANCVA